ncbi:hypothetical protein Rmet_6757 (plasmid) [Cupriavidus metallidurans CH34]|uniref:Uncharacterized protein n=1 Tax=Cupriavidus metallidurans (strain ATCC 43123 / DSM 2839 / NBRC 102507 / CH34) TaxID=266264 RepID=D3DYG6_CUPMC|nr:hypothetical protein Rmet_6757 [Cupriavidus metallidurans CH34]
MPKSTPHAFAIMKFRMRAEVQGEAEPGASAARGAIVLVFLAAGMNAGAMRLRGLSHVAYAVMNGKGAEESDWIL